MAAHIFWRLNRDQTNKIDCMKKVLFTTFEESLNDIYLTCLETRWRAISMIYSRPFTFLLSVKAISYYTKNRDSATIIAILVDVFPNLVAIFDALDFYRSYFMCSFLCIDMLGLTEKYLSGEQTVFGLI